MVIGAEGVTETPDVAVAERPGDTEAVPEPVWVPRPNTVLEGVGVGVPLAVGLAVVVWLRVGVVVAVAVGGTLAVRLRDDSVREGEQLRDAHKLREAVRLPLVLWVTVGTGVTLGEGVSSLDIVRLRDGEKVPV